MKKITSILILTLLFVFCYSPAAAIAKDNYVVIKAGKYMPTGDLDDFDNAFLGELAFGHNFTPNFGVEFGIGHFETEASYSGYNVYLGNWSETDKASVTPVTVTARGIVPVEKVSLYAGIGVGIYFVKGEADLTSEAVNLSLDDDDQVPGIHALVGIEYNFTPEAFIGIEAKHTWTDDAEFSGSINGIPLEVKTNLNGYNIAAKVGFRF
ncbi:unnamed protein product [marine sediment metagenome]|uniref:Outer membrane protein beta-barrel domain-containing protein n=1 Tax=marine sediment metagenome TaxID=412755 RepID=X1RNP8_9ZZZZ